MTTQELQQDALKRRKEVLESILAEIEEFGLECSCDIPKDPKKSPTYDFANLRIFVTPFFFDFRIDLISDKIIILAYTIKRLLNISIENDFLLTMANIDELLMAIKSYENIYIPKLQK